MKNKKTHIMQKRDSCCRIWIKLSGAFESQIISIMTKQIVSNRKENRIDIMYTHCISPHDRTDKRDKKQTQEEIGSF
jgi:heterodisulfide reductase subunit B